MIACSHCYMEDDVVYVFNLMLGTGIIIGRRPLTVITNLAHFCHIYETMYDWLALGRF